MAGVLHRVSLIYAIAIGLIVYMRILLPVAQLRRRLIVRRVNDAAPRDGARLRLARLYVLQVVLALILVPVVQRLLQLRLAWRLVVW